MKSWHEKDVNAGHQPLGEFSQMNDMLEQIPEVMEGDAFSLTCATKEGLDTGNTEARTDSTPQATPEVDTAIVVETPEAVEEVEIPPSKRTAIPGPGGTTVLLVLEEEVEMTRELPTGEEDLQQDEEAVHRRKAQLLPADDVDMASAVKTDSVDKGENEQNGQVNPGQEPTLDEAADIILSLIHISEPTRPY